jgi:ATP-binding protein involved in chromosome partitioning
MRTARLLHSCARLNSHENPLNLPRSSSSSAPPPSRPRLPPRGTLPPRRPIQNVRKVIAVSSAKGGVGKSTLAVNLALAFSRAQLRTGILDTDIFGPSIPTLLGLDGKDVGLPDVTREGKLVPLRSWGLGSMSMGYLLGKKSNDTNKESGDGDGDGPLAWRGLMVQKALQQLLHEVQWAGGIGSAVPELDVLVLDLPPGTGDVQLTIAQQVVLDGVVIVSTPQDVALKDAVRGVRLFQKMDIPVLGLVRNMDLFVCPRCGEETKIFAHQSHDGMQGALQDRMRQMGVEALGHIPLDPQICYDADQGKPTIVAEEGRGKRVNSRFYEEIARQVAGKVGLEWKGKG